MSKSKLFSVEQNAGESRDAGAGSFAMVGAEVKPSLSRQSARDSWGVMSQGFFAGKTVLVMGLGRFGGGVDAAKFVASAGGKVVVTDLAPALKLRDSIEELGGSNDIEYHLGGHDPGDFEQADIIIANPAVAPGNEYLAIARRHGKLVTSQMGLFFQLCPARIVGITGANGKSTTTTLTAHLLRNAKTEDGRQKTEDRREQKGGRRQSSSEQRAAKYEIRNTKYERVWLSGNIGDQPLLTILDQIGPNDLVVLEISSFQLEQLAQVRKAPDVALLTNLTPNHLDRYGTFAAYCQAKENIFKFQQPRTDTPAVSIFNGEDEIAAKWFERYNGQAGRICVKFSADDVSDDVRGVFALPGRANLSNLAGAMAIAGCFGVGESAVKGCLADFKALPDRLELVAEIKGVRWYNDSKATTPQGAMVALEAFDCPEILIAGGYDKHLAFDELGERIAEKAKSAILIGQTASKIAEAIRRGSSGQSRTQIRMAGSLAEAVGCARGSAVSGDVVLLSPACASYDMFENYQQRGREFIKLVRALSA